MNSLSSSATHNNPAAIMSVSTASHQSLISGISQCCNQEINTYVSYCMPGIHGKINQLAVNTVSFRNIRHSAPISTLMLQYIHRQTGTHILTMGELFVAKLFTVWLRFWSFQILACSMPSIIFVIYSGHKAREKSKLESEAKKRQKERAQRTTGLFIINH